MKRIKICGMIDIRIMNLRMKKILVFFKEWLQKFEPPTILMRAYGEGRNVVYTAVLGWLVISFDLIEAGNFKSLVTWK